MPANLPIGQGLSMTLLQMTGGVPGHRQRWSAAPPRIIAPPSHPDGSRTEEPRPDDIRVVSAQTAWTVPDAACRGATRIRWATSRYRRRPGCPWHRMAGAIGRSTLAALLLRRRGITPLLPTIPATIGIMLDNPARNPTARLGTGRPVVHNIAGWLMRSETSRCHPIPGLLWSCRPTQAMAPVTRAPVRFGSTNFCATCAR